MFVGWQQPLVTLHKPSPFSFHPLFICSYTRHFHPFTRYCRGSVADDKCNFFLASDTQPLTFLYIANDFIYVYYVFESAIIIYLS